jgi:hypothetical protein
MILVPMVHSFVTQSTWRLRHVSQRVIKFVHPGCSDLYVILACLMSSSVTKQFCVLRWEMYGIDGCQIWTVRSSISEPKFCSKFQVCSAACGQALSWRRTTHSLRRLGHSPDSLLQTIQCGALLGINWTAVFHKVHWQYIQRIPEDNAQHYASR